MTNGNSIDRAFAKIEALERRVEDRAQRRDSVDEETRTAVVDLAARLGNLTAAVGRLESVKPVSLAALWSPAAATIGMVAALLWLVMTLRVDPVAEKAQKIEQANVTIGKIERDIAWLVKYQDANKERIAGLQATLTELRVQVAKEQRQ